MPDVRIHCTPLNLEIALTIPTEVEPARPFTVLRSASLATVLLAVDQPSDEVYLSIRDGGTTTYYHALHTVDTTGTFPRQSQDSLASPPPAGRSYLAALPFLSLLDSPLLYAALEALVAEVFREDLTVADNSDAISDAADRASWALQLYQQVRDQREGRNALAVLALLERDLAGCSAASEAAARIGAPLSNPPAPADVLAWLLYEAKRVEELAAAPPAEESRAGHMAYATRLRGYQACLACLGVEQSALLFRLREADREGGLPGTLGGGQTQ